MKKIFLGFTVIVFYSAAAQNENTVVINPVKHNEQELFKKILQYSDFVPGKAYDKDGVTTEAKFNYSYFSNQILFITPRGDTLELINGGNFSQIVIGIDTFYYCDKHFIQKITHYPSYNLLLKHSLESRGSEKKGAYDTYSGNSAISSVNLIIDNMGTVKLATDENIIFAFKDYYFVVGNYDQFYPATKKGFSDLFGKNEKQLKEFLAMNNINFNKKEDLGKVLEYTRAVLK